MQKKTSGTIIQVVPPRMLTIREAAGEGLPRMLTIREAAREGPLSEYALRMLQKQGQLPGILICTK